MENRAERKFVFERDGRGCVIALEIAGMAYRSPLRRVKPGESTPFDGLLRGDPNRAVSLLLASGATRDPGQLVRIGERMALVPSLVPRAVRILRALAEQRPSAAAHTALGDALVAAGDRRGALVAYRRAHAADTQHVAARTALERLGVLRPAADTGWKLPFDLSRVFDQPTLDETARVLADWEARDLTTRAAREVLRRPADMSGTRVIVRIIEHQVHGVRHIGAILIPDGAKPGCCPIVLEAKGVSPSFFPLQIPGGLTAPDVLGEDRGRYIYVAPGYRGEMVRFGTDSFLSEGDRSDAWDGATDDLLALLSAAVATTPEADSSRVCVFGRSRGGTVALLAGLRDQRIDCVVAWAAPTDWFRLMDQQGWTNEEVVRQGLRQRSQPGDEGGQFIDYFLKRAIEKHETLPHVRARLLASSPLWFAELLPSVQSHWGLEDAIVPARNGQALGRRLASARRPAGCDELLFHRDAGHDQDGFGAPRATRAFLRRHLLERRPAQACRPGARPH
jgi:hypothetical protein